MYNRQQETETLGRFCETLVGHNVLLMPLNEVAVTVLCHSSGAPNDQIFHIVRRIYRIVSETIFLSGCLELGNFGHLKSGSFRLIRNCKNLDGCGGKFEGMG